MSQFIQYGMYAIYAIIIFIILRNLFSSSIKQYHSNWNTFIEGFQFSTKEFYTLLEEEVKKNGLKGIEFSTVLLDTSYMFSGQRLYLRIEWKHLQYDICLATVGKGNIFISWWLLNCDSLGKILVSKIPFIGERLALKLYPVTYYTIDTSSIFMCIIQSSVLKVVDDITNDKGVRALIENERKPILNNIFKR